MKELSSKNFTKNKRRLVALAGAAFATVLIVAAIPSLGINLDSIKTSADAQSSMIENPYTGDPTELLNDTQTPPQFDKVKVYIFPRDIHKFQHSGELASELRTVNGIKLAMDYGPNTGASKEGIYNVIGNVTVPNAAEFYISPDLKKPDGTQVTVEDIPESMAFGNGVVVSDLLLNPAKQGPGNSSESDNTIIPAIWIVVGGDDIATADENLEAIEDTARSHVSSEATFKELFPDIQ